MSSFGTKYKDIFNALTEDFHPDQIRQRELPGGRAYWYVTARTVMNRLDAILGPENWWDRYSKLEGAVLCELTIRLPDGEEITKCDAGGNAGMADEGDDFKSGCSDAFKRAAVKFGIGRVFYGDGLPNYREAPAAAPPAPTPPKSSEKPAPQPPKGRQANPSPDFTDGKVRAGEASFGGATRPISGKVGETVNELKAHASAVAVAEEPMTAEAFYALVRAKDPKRNNGLVLHLIKWGRTLGHPDLISQWDNDQARRGYDELRNYLELKEED